MKESLPFSLPLSVSLSLPPSSLSSFSSFYPPSYAFSFIWFNFVNWTFIGMSAHSFTPSSFFSSVPSPPLNRIECFYSCWDYLPLFWLCYGVHASQVCAYERLGSWELAVENSYSGNYFTMYMKTITTLTFWPWEKSWRYNVGSLSEPYVPTTLCLTTFITVRITKILISYAIITFYSNVMMNIV